MRIYSHGLIVGKFMPLHKGHCLVIDTALSECKQVTICLMSRDDEVISGGVRLLWLQQLYESHCCTIVHHTNKLPQDKSGQDHWEEYLQSLLAVCTYKYDAVFSSESYGSRLANDLEATHILVDQARSTIPVSGTAIRDNPDTYIEYLPDIVKSYYEIIERN